MIEDALTYLIEAEIRRAVGDGLLALNADDDANRLARRIALKLTEGREKYRSGRRTYDKLRDRLLALWRKP